MVVSLPLLARLNSVIRIFVSFTGDEIDSGIFLGAGHKEEFITALFFAVRARREREYGMYSALLAVWY